MVSMLGINNALSIRSASQRELKGRFERKALFFGVLLSVVGTVAGWFAMPLLVPATNPELLWLSRVGLVHVPLFVLTSNLMAIDQGCGDFGIFNLARNVLTPVYLLLLLALWWAGVRDVVWFLGALLAANLAVLAYRLSVVRWHQSGNDEEAADDRGLFRTGLPFWITGIVAVLRDNAERLLLMFLLGPAALGLYVAASTASAAHLNVSRSLNLIVFSRAASLKGQHAFSDAARFFRLMGLMNFILGLGMVAGMPLLIRVIYGPEFTNALLPAMMLVAAQYFVSQGAILDEALRARANPLIGLGGMLVGSAVFAAVGYALTGPFGLLGVAGASIAGQLAYSIWMITAFRKASGGLRLVPGRADFAELGLRFRETKQFLVRRFAARAAA